MPRNPRSSGGEYSSPPVKPNSSIPKLGERDNEPNPRSAAKIRGDETIEDPPNARWPSSAQENSEDGLHLLSTTPAQQKKMSGESAMRHHQPTEPAEAIKYPMGSPAQVEEQAGEESLETEPLDEPHLIICGGHGLGDTYVLQRADNTIGRGLDCDFVIADIAASRRHAVVSYENGQFFVKDLGSGNGTTVNGLRVEKQLLKDHDKLEIGNTQIRFVCPINEVELAQMATRIAASSGEQPKLTEQHPQMLPGPQAAPSLIPATSPSRSQISPSRSQISSPPSQISAQLSGPHARSISRDSFNLLRGPLARQWPRPLFWGAVTGLVLLALAVLGVVLLWGGESPENSVASGPQNNEELAATELKEGIKYFEQRDWEKARMHLFKVLALSPNYSPANDYAKLAAAEITVRDKVSAAYQDFSNGNYVVARRKLDQIPASSLYAPEVRKLQREIDEHRIAAILEGARQLFAAGERRAAVNRFKEARAINQSSPQVKRFSFHGEQTNDVPKQEEIAPEPKATSETRVTIKERGKEKERERIKDRDSEKTRRGDIKSREESSGRRATASSSAKMKKAEEETKSAAGKSATATDPALAAAKAKAQAAWAAGRYEEAYAALRPLEKQIKNDPALQKIKSDLDRKAEELLAKANGLRGSNIAQARALWQQVLRLVSPRSAIYQKAYNALNTSVPGQNDDDE